MKVDKNMYRVAKKSQKRMIALPNQRFGGGWDDTSYIYDQQAKKWAFVGIEGHTFNQLTIPQQESVLQTAIWCSSKDKAKKAYKEAYA